MKTLQNIQNQIVKLTTNIEINYPELYSVLDETPVSINYNTQPRISIKALEDYLESLKQILKQYIKTHHKK
ncbi:hypothetical protein [Mangrovimonas cancribranchiae]|uniref:Uncharacterized protein n=1 Tax=Mangrovimonas cancribranchiae TaxID=3080055 RepID=A0AAU6P959_9FLAO